MHLVVFTDPKVSVPVGRCPKADPAIVNAMNTVTIVFIILSFSLLWLNANRLYNFKVTNNPAIQQMEFARARSS